MRGVDRFDEIPGRRSVSNLHQSARQIPNRQAGTVVVYADLVKANSNHGQQCNLNRAEPGMGFIPGLLKGNDHSKGGAGQQSGDVSGIIDFWNREPDDEVDHNNRKDSGSNGAFDKRRKRIAIPDTKCQQHTEQTEDRTRSAGRNRVWMVRIAAVDARNSRQHVKNDKASASIELLDLRPNDPKSVRVEEQMKQPNVNKDRSNEPPPLAFRNFGIRLHTKCHQRRFVGAASGQRHQKKNENIQSEEDVCISGTPCPDSLKKVEMVVRNH